MESFANAGVKPLVIEPKLSLSRAARLSAYLELTKPRITLLVVLTAMAGFCLASSAGIDYTALLNMSLGIALLSSGIATLNQYLERDTDGLMRRTESRPLPAGKLRPSHALVFRIITFRHRNHISLGVD
jgi:protoheme IX farnesyltransferase